MNQSLILSLVQNFSEVVGWLLLHSVWQFALLAGLLALIDRGLHRQSSRTRYAVLLIGFLLLPLTPLLTLIWFPSPSNFSSAQRSELLGKNYLNANEGSLFRLWEDGNGAKLNNTFDGTAAIPAPSQESEVPVSPEPASSPSAVIDPDSVNRWKAWLSTCALLWSCGVLLFSLRLALGFWTVRRLCATALTPFPESLQKIAERLQHQLSVRRAVCFRQSNRIESPVVVGCFKSMILVPTSLVTNMPTEQLEAILVHELLHVRRYDYAINLLQTWIETLFFYHPAVWWLSKRIREERECCCDDGVVSIMSNRVEYGRALLAIGNMRAQRHVLPVGSGDGLLLHRVRRLFLPSQVDTPVGILLPLLGLLMFLICMFSAAQQLAAPVSPSDERGPTAESLVTPQDQKATGDSDGPGAKEPPVNQEPTELLSIKNWEYIQERPPRDMKAAYAASDQKLWRNYLAVVEKIRNVSCAFEIHQRGGFEYTENTDDGYFVRNKVKSYVWNLETGHFIAEKSTFSHTYLPPHHWRTGTRFHSDQSTGRFFPEEFWGIQQRSDIHWVPAVPHPMNFVSAGRIGVADFVSSNAWTIAESGDRLILETSPEATRKQRVTLDLDPAHDWMPKTIEVYEELSDLHKFNTQYVVDRFTELDGVWLPGEMRVEFFRDEGKGMTAGPYPELRIRVDASTLRVNQDLGPEVFRFEVPAGAVWDNEDTGERIDGELGRQRMEENRKNRRNRQPSESNQTDDKLPDESSPHVLSTPEKNDNDHRVANEKAEALVRGVIDRRRKVESCKVTANIRHQMFTEDKDYSARNETIIDEKSGRMYFYFDSDFHPDAFKDVMAIFRDQRMHFRGHPNEIEIRGDSTRLDVPFFYPVHCLGLTDRMEFEADKRSLAAPESMFGLDDPNTNFELGQIEQVNGIQVQKAVVRRQNPDIEWRLMIDPETFRVYELSADSAIYPGKVKGTDILTTIKSTYSEQNRSPIPNRVEIREQDGDRVTVLVEIEVEELQIPYEAPDSDFLLSRFDLKPNARVYDSEERRLRPTDEYRQPSKSNQADDKLPDELSPQALASPEMQDNDLQIVSEKAVALVRGVLDRRRSIESCKVTANIRHQMFTENKDYSSRNETIIDEKSGRMYFYLDSDFYPAVSKDVMAIFRDQRLHFRGLPDQVDIRGDSTGLDVPFFYPVHCLGITSYLEFEADKRTLAVPEAMLALEDPNTEVELGQVEQVDGVHLQKVVVRRQNPNVAWRLKIDPETFRIYEFSADSAMYPDTVEGTNFVTTITSTYSEQNHSPIPNRVEIREQDGDRVTILIEIEVEELQIPYEAPDSDFSLSRFDLKPNARVYDNQEKRFKSTDEYRQSK